MIFGSGGEWGDNKIFESTSCIEQFSLEIFSKMDPTTCHGH